MINLFNIRYSKKFPFIHISKSNLFAIFFISLILGIIGFILETMIEYISSEVLTDRGFLNGPFIPVYFVYGFISLLFIKVPEKNLFNFFKLTFVFGVLVTIIEFITGNLLELISKASLWSYSHLPLSGKYISLIVSSIWGILTSLFYTFIVPALYKVTLSINTYLASLICIMFFTIFSADLTLTITNLIKNQKYVKQYEISATREITSLFLLFVFYFFVVSYILFIFIKLKFIKLKSCGTLLIILFLTPITFILFYLLN